MSFRASLFGQINLVLVIFSAFIYIGYPLTTQERNLPYGIYIIGTDLQAPWIFEFAYLVQFIITMSSGLLYISFTNMFVSFMAFGFTLLQILHRKFETIAGNYFEATGPDNELIAKRYRLYIENHTRIIRYVREMNGIVSMVCLVEIILFLLLLCALLFLIIIVDKMSQFGLAVTYIMFVLFHLFVIYYISNEMIQQVREGLVISSSLLTNIKLFPEHHPWSSSV